MIAALEACQTRWLKIGQRNDVIGEADASASAERVEAIRALLSSDRFEEVQKQVPAEIAFLEDDIQRRITKAADAAVKARISRRRMEATAYSVGSKLRERGFAPSDVLDSPEKHSSDDLSFAISKAFSVLAPPDGDRGMSERQIEIARDLGAGEARQTLSEWLSAQEQDNADPELIALERIVEELRAVDQSAASAFDGRVAALSREENPARKRLVRDSFMLDASAARTDALLKAKLMMKLDAMTSRLRATGDLAALTSATTIASALETPATQAALNDLLAAAEVVLVEAENRKAADYRRKSLLTGLSQLGYEVHEGMETAWVRDGKVVLRNSASDTYGVEVGGNPENLVQIRTVAYDRPGANRTAEQDRAAETTFCDAFSSLRAELGENGGNITIVRALGVGATPVKSVAIEGTRTVSEEVDLPVVHGRHL
ncbi:hypothetical protein [Neorhizobium alkalisoli]|uniref:hypothetical protein n=1 Tax=Neorhizobium alkalisoli TaxID=528178 RepID=UPI00131A0DC0|nr:hypothetical protein [Neorhizobium alkalisoli]